MKPFAARLRWPRPARLPTVGRLVACSLVALGTPVLAQTPQGVDPALGHDLAARVCSACHLIEPRDAGPVVDGVPTLMSIADALDDAAIETLLLAPSHPAMPEPPLTGPERAQVIAYIRSLASD
jgi:mono/diheme cytochrome c family protein